MIWFFVGAFAVGVLGMVGVIARHMRELFQLESPSPLPTAGERRVLEHVGKRIRMLEAYGKLKLRPLFFSSLARSLKWAEERMIALVRSARKYQRELSQHARVSPKESQYWKDISEWKSSSGEVEKRTDGQGDDAEKQTPSVTPTSAVVESAVVVAPEVRAERSKMKRPRVARVTPVKILKTVKRTRKSAKKDVQSIAIEEVDAIPNSLDNS